MKYELTGETRDLGDGEVVHRIRGLDGRAGGFVGSPANLTQEGACWLHGDSVAHGQARVSEDAQVYGRVGERAQVRGSATIYGQVLGDAVVEGRAKVYGSVSGDHHLGGDAVVYGVLN